MHQQLFNLRLPVFAAPMFLISGPEMVLAACRAGIIGAFPTPNARPIEFLDVWMKQITEGLAQARDQQAGSTIGPWCANLVTHSSNSRLPEDLALIAKYKPPIVVTALGSPKPAIEVVHNYGGLVFADVIDIKLARKAVAAGADGLACVCAGAGGHTGMLSPFAFVSAVREFFDGTVIVGGGISDGWGIAGALACGADYVYMGTRFIPTTVAASPVPPPAGSSHPFGPWALTPTTCPQHQSASTTAASLLQRANGWTCGQRAKAWEPSKPLSRWRWSWTGWQMNTPWQQGASNNFPIKV